MTVAELLLPWLRDPIVWLVVGTLLLLAWRLSDVRRRRLRRELAQLRQRAAQAASPRERHALLQQWRALGGARELARAAQLRSARAQGQQARAEGRPLSANPYRHGLWGPGRLWKQGWHAVERNIRWLEAKRG